MRTWPLVLLATALCGCPSVFHSTNGKAFGERDRDGPGPDAQDNAVRASAEHDLKCDASSIAVGKIHAYGSEFQAYADGCGKRATYAFGCSVHFGVCECPLILTSLFALP